ncbi:MAG: linear amide C-N hydrolase [Bacteroidales bacterium]|nr:linear amide C-N hydrolase [Bacteroidales bacterium]
MKKGIFLTLAVFITTLVLIQFSNPANACTRAVYKGTDGNYLTARSMDWVSEIPANLWVMPRGIERTGLAGSNSVAWTAKYGSLVTSAWDIATADGMNEKGLVANVLWLVETAYPKFTPDSGKKGLVVSLWGQFALDNFASVKEAVAYFSKDEITVVSDYLPGTDTYATVHLSLSDADGDNAIFEYIDGKLVIHHDKSYNVMTNSPTFDQQLALNSYWKSIPGSVMLPGTNRAADRFVRASYYMDAIPKNDNTRVAVASVFSVIRNCSVPFGISMPNEPNIASTRWRTVSDHKNMLYYYESALTPNTFWVDMNKLDFSEKAPVKKLAVDKEQSYSGETSAMFEKTKAFEFFGLE